MIGQMIWIVLYTLGLDSCLGKLMVDLVGISRVSRDLPITKCLIPGVPDNLTLGHIPAWGRHLPSLAFTTWLNQLPTPPVQATKIHTFSSLREMVWKACFLTSHVLGMEAQSNPKSIVITKMNSKLRNVEQHRREMETSIVWCFVCLMFWVLKNITQNIDVNYFSKNVIKTLHRKAKSTIF